MQAYNNTKDFRDANQKATEKNSLFGQIKELTGWGGEPLDNSKNLDVIDQSTQTLAKYNMPPNTGACVYLSSVYAAADALGVPLSPEEAAKVYEAAKKNGSVFKKGTGDKKDAPYWVNDFPDLVKTVAAVKKNLPAETKSQLQASATIGGFNNLTCPNEGKIIKSDTRQVATKEIVETLKNKGAVQIRYDADPSKPDSVAHTMRVTGSFVENGNVILKIKDTNKPKTETFVNASTMQLYTIGKDNDKVYSKRPVINYRPITNNQKQGEGKL